MLAQLRALPAEKLIASFGEPFELGLLPLGTTLTLDTRSVCFLRRRLSVPRRRRPASADPRATGESQEEADAARSGEARGAVAA